MVNFITANYSSNSTFIEFVNISKYYGTFQALNNISFQIQKGEIWGYIGPNGAGKTTSIKILVGLLPFYEGIIRINGIDIKKTRNNIYQILGYLPQEAGFQEWLSVDRALKTFGKLSRLPTDQLDERISSVLNLVGLQDVRYKKIVHLSGGMQQKLRLAQALLHDPEILVLDEPMSGLDPTSRYQMKNVIRNLASQGKTIFFSSHILNDVQDISTRVAILNKGRILRIGSPRELQKEFQVGNSIEITFSDKIPSNMDWSHIPGLDRVEDNQPTQQIFHLSGSVELDEVIHALLQELLFKGVSIRHFNVVQPNLEQIYLKLITEDQS